MSHPAVEAITYWGIRDGGWLDASGGFLRTDGSRKPSYDALHGLIKGDWWLAPTTLATDDAGRIRFTGFLGEYEVSVGDRSTTFHLDRSRVLGLSVAV